MPELAKVTENLGSDRVNVSVRFELTEDRVHALHLDVTGAASLICQRCLDTLDVDLSGPFTLALVATEAGMQKLPEGWDGQMLDADGTIDVHALIQEELLLRVPMVPKHEQECGLVINEDNPIEKPNPFAVLAQLKGKTK